MAVSMHKEAMGSDGGYHSLCRLIQPRPSLHLLVSSSIRYDLSLPLSLFKDYWFYIFFNTSCCDATISSTYCGQAENGGSHANRSYLVSHIGLCQQHDVVPLIYKVTSNLPFSDSFLFISTIICPILPILILLLPAQQSVHYVFDRMLPRDKKKVSLIFVIWLYECVILWRLSNKPCY